MIDANAIQAVLLGSGGFIGTAMAGVGAFRLFNSGARIIERVPTALERSAEAQERQAVVAEQNAELAKMLYDLRDGQDQIRITMSSLAEHIQELPCALAAPGVAPEKCEVK